MDRDKLLLLRGSRELLKRVAEASNGAVLVGFSGGKDSLAVLDLCCQHFEKVEAFFLYIVKGLRSVEAPVHAGIARFKVKLHMLPHPVLSDLFRTGECRPHIKSREIPKVTQVDVERALRVRTGIEWFAGGHRMCDSLHRRGMLHRCSGFDTKGRRSYPLWEWAPADVHSYLRSRGIPIPPALVKGQSSGFDLRAATLLNLKERHPDDYAKVLEIFPYADAQVRSLERTRHESTAVHDAPHEQAGDQGSTVQPANDRHPREEEA